MPLGLASKVINIKKPEPTLGKRRSGLFVTVKVAKVPAGRSPRSAVNVVPIWVLPYRAVVKSIFGLFLVLIMTRKNLATARCAESHALAFGLEIPCREDVNSKCDFMIYMVPDTEGHILLAERKFKHQFTTKTQRAQWLLCFSADRAEKH